MIIEAEMGGTHRATDVRSGGGILRVEKHLAVRTDTLLVKIGARAFTSAWRTSWLSGHHTQHNVEGRSDEVRIAKVMSSGVNVQ
ncbi:hypothetical protein Tco_0679432 [Tanacetum coccineum]|uniref:Uncharacterized protein n=1 Tax=Tanacetum coccineum TaxID=301880 RepID=A0ABQ4XIS6_9ASTR